MAKQVISIRISDEDIALLKKMADAHVRPVSSEFTYILRKVAAEEGFKVQPAE